MHVPPLNTVFILAAVAAAGWSILPACAASEAGPVQEEIVVLIPKPKTIVRTDQPASPAAGCSTTPAAVTPAPGVPRTIEQVYERFHSWPGQVYLDTPTGPKMLFGTDVVYDQNGFPVPRLPDPYTYAVIVNPSDNVAMRNYLDWRAAVMRRTRIAMNRVPDAAYEFGHLTPEVVEVQPNRPTDRMQVGDMRAVETETLGTPMVAPGRARELGLKPDEVPNLPGARSPSGIEVYLFWHQRCSFCQQMMRDWFAFANQVNKAGHKAVGINMSPIQTNEEIEAASAEVAAYLEIQAILVGDDADRSRNWLDWTGVAKVLGVTATPTTIIINRKKPAMVRLDGPQDQASLRAAVQQVAGWTTWPPPSAEGKAAVAAPAAPPIPGTTPLPR